ncbi:MAG: hypothetical protein V8T45_00515 [Oscillospiraceae bacterium]
MMTFMVLALTIYLAFSLAARFFGEMLPAPGICAPFFRFPFRSSRPYTGVMDAQFSHLPEDPEPTVLLMMVDGQLYQSAGRESDRDGRCGIMDGQITDSVERNFIPSGTASPTLALPTAISMGTMGSWKSIWKAAGWFSSQPKVPRSRALKELKGRKLLTAPDFRFIFIHVINFQGAFSP